MPSDRSFRLKSTEWVALAAMLTLLALFAWRSAAGSWAEALIVTFIFAICGWLLRGVSTSGAMTGWMAAFILYAGGGRRMFAVLFTVFVLTLLTTQAGRGRKQWLGVAEPRVGRSAAQVAANLFIASAAIVVLPPALGIFLCIAALAEAAADTVSSEIGEAFGKQTYLVTTMRPTNPGTDGGISLLGTAAGIAAAMSVAAAGLLLTDFRSAVMVAAAGALGMLMDSVLGATFEHRGYLNNEAVNLLGTASSAALAYNLYRLI
ncbi:MAG TPA: DUF92 domain-containing protein [Terriglobales bacterium]|nr:DUF92 domain-containing protein [Terriglobales bacterium]